MVSLLKRLFPIPMVLHRVIIFFLLTFVGLISAFGIQFLSPEMVIGVKPQTEKLICSTTNSPEQLSGQGRTSYEQGRFDEAIDCWQKAVATYRKLGNENEAVNNQINQAQAEQALGLYPRACNTLVRIYGQEDCTTLLKDEQKGKQFREALHKLADSPSKITGLRILGNVFRGLGELNWSYQTLVSLVNPNNPQPQQGDAIWLDLGNTIRALSNREQDFYNRSQEPENINCAFTYADVANNVYQKALDYNNQVSDSQSVIKLQAQLNQLSLVLDLKDWGNKIKKDTKGKEDIFKNNTNISSSQRRKCFLNLATSTQTSQSGNSKLQLNDENINWLFQHLPSKNLLIQSQQIDHLQQQIDQLPPNHTELSIRLNFAKSLIRLQDFPELKVKQFLLTTINQAHKLGDLRAESYGFGYLGKLYEDKEWELAKNNTQQALFLAQSIPAPDIEYQWEWQLGRIYKLQAAQREKAQTKGIQEDGKDLKQGREMYKRAYQTLQSLRTELVAGNPDGQVFFQNDIEGFYREYVDLLLWDDNPEQEYLSQAREVIASLQAVELENFLRAACPEYNLEQIDEIINEQAKKTAFLYPIVLDDRIEVILKLPTDSNQKNSAPKGLKHYRTLIDRAKVEEQINKLQLDLEEEYTFDDVQREAREVYRWLVEGAEKYLSKDIDTLVFALDTNLRNIPLAALVVDVKPEGKPQYLVDKYAIALAPRLEIPTPRLLQGKTLKILAAGLSESKENQQFPSLRFVTEELKAINELGNSRVSVSQLIDDKFQVENFKEKLNGDIFQVVHLATHGEFSSSPEKTFILASDKLIKVNEIDNLFRKQAQNQPEPIELLVLNACETAAGDRRATLGISGVSVRAGARSAIASLWTLDDEISVEFTKEFYKQLVNPKLTKAKALQNAQIKLKDSHGREHPRYWAPYILLGNWL